MGKEIRKAPRDRITAGRKKAPQRKRGRLLVVDDDLLIRDTISAALGGKYEVIGAASGVEAEEYVKSAKPDVIVLDVGLPEKDGFTVCKELRNLDETADIPVLFLTALDGRDDMLSALAAGGDVFMTKPFEMYKLEERIEFLLAKALKERKTKRQEGQ